jgi:hypothetical protein
VIHLPGPLVAVLGEMVAKLRAAGEHAICDQYAAVLSADLHSTATLESPPKSRRVRSPEAREADRLRKAAERMSATRPPVGHVADSGGQSGGHLADIQKVLQTSPKEEEKRKPLLSGKVSAESESLERGVESASATRPTEIRPADNGGQNGGQVADGSVVHPHAMWRQIFDQWVFIAHHGKGIGSPSGYAKDFGDVARMAEERDPREPVRYATDVIRRYVADRRARGKKLAPQWFARDFASFADEAPSAEPGRRAESPLERQYRELDAQWQAARSVGDAVTERRLYGEIAAIGRQMVAR